MLRPPRLDCSDAVYHVTTRGNGRADIFWNDDDRARFLGQRAQHLHLAGVVLSAVAEHYDVAVAVLSAHGRRAGPAKAVAVELAARLAGMSGRAIGARDGIGATAVGAIHQRLGGRPDVLEVVESLAQQLRKSRTKWTV